MLAEIRGMTLSPSAGSPQAVLRLSRLPVREACRGGQRLVTDASYRLNVGQMTPVFGHIANLYHELVDPDKPPKGAGIRHMGGRGQGA